MNESVLNMMDKIPEGYSEGIYCGTKYGITKTFFNKGKSLKIFGKALGGSDFVSFNYYFIKNEGLLKPCEMPESKVIDFLQKLMLTPDKEQ
ncbi:peptide methionine sulfoxide reductase [Maribacter algicola]|uniref:Peptide methionine sulfoxide reductase n=1 Tax=Meishania litoralis TaxID=3434685 RepID=A0ACC7LG84_9FLAO